MNQDAIGFVETRGLVGLIEASDAMCKAAAAAEKEAADKEAAEQEAADKEAAEQEVAGREAEQTADDSQ